MYRYRDLPFPPDVDCALPPFVNAVVTNLTSVLSFSTLATMQYTSTSSLQSSDDECSAIDPNETSDNLPGHGRLLGNLYASIGSRLENILGRNAGNSMPATMSNNSTSSPVGLDDKYYVCSAPDANETADNLPGHGRQLGNFYACVGGKLEYRVGRVAQRMGLGPQTVASKIRKIQNDDFIRHRRRKLEKNCRQLARYVK